MKLAVKDKIGLAFRTNKNYDVLDLPGSEKSLHTISVINKLDLTKEIVIWCSYSFSELKAKQSRINKKSIIVGSDHNKSTDLVHTLKEIPEDIEVVLMPLQFYRKFKPLDFILKIKPVKKVVIDELSYIDILVPSFYDSAAIYGSDPKEIVKKVFCKQDFYNQKEKMEQADKTPSWAYFITNKQVSHLVLSAETLTSICLKKCGYSIIKGDLQSKKSCILNLYADKRCNRNFVSWMDTQEKWLYCGYDNIFCNKSKSEETINHTLVRGSNSFIGKKCLTVFRRFGNVAEYSFKEQMKLIMPDEDPDYLHKCYMTDTLNQVVSRTLGFRGAEEVDCLTHPNCLEVIDKELFPYTINSKEVTCKTLSSLLHKSTNVDTKWFDKIVFEKGTKMRFKQLKEISKITATKALKLLISNGYDVEEFKMKGERWIRNCRINPEFLEGEI